jgi:hypothetical protein
MSVRVKGILRPSGRTVELPYISGAQFTPEAIIVRDQAVDLQQIPGGDQFTVLTNWDSKYNPNGYYSVNTPELEAPGFVIPEGKGGLHRVSFFCEHTIYGTTSQYYVRRAIAFLNLEETRDDMAVISLGGAVELDRALSTQVLTMEMNDREECYFYMKQDSGHPIDVRWPTCATIERLNTS